MASRPISEAPHVIKSSYMSVSPEFLTTVLDALNHCGAFLRGVSMEAVTYRIEYCHPQFEGEETRMVWCCDKGGGSYRVSIENIAESDASNPSPKES